MAFVTVSKEFTWDMAHMLSGHLGLCANVHGHTYKMQVQLNDDLYSADRPDAEGMVIDFKELKDVVKDLIVDKLDHAFLAWVGGNAAEMDIIDVLNKHDLKVVVVDWRPTAENMAKEFFKTLRKHYGVTLHKVIVWETPTSFAEYGEA